MNKHCTSCSKKTYCSIFDQKQQNFNLQTPLTGPRQHELKGKSRAAGAGSHQERQRGGQEEAVLAGEGVQLGEQEAEQGERHTVQQEQELQEGGQEQGRLHIRVHVRRDRRRESARRRKEEERGESDRSSSGEQRSRSSEQEDDSGPGGEEAGG